MDYTNIIFTVEDGIATIVFNRPKALNALNDELMIEFSGALDAISCDENIRVLILTGAGEKSFVAGADITELAKFNSLEGKIFAKNGQSIIGKLQELAIPVIAAVNGFALGGGNEVVLACDIVYASEKAMFGLPEINLGLIPGFGGTQRLPRLIGTNMAKEMIFTGKMISASEALTIGLVNKVFAPDALMAETLKTAKLIASKGKVSLRAAKQAINNGINADLVTGFCLEADAFALCMSSKDKNEGTSAFLEKRKAVFKGTLKD
ncbi:MAG: enoyl-CoA hydratase/isomerase family protein [Desulfobacterium sp.]|nr:enoyl-CoA hydratase/isomerase family protein [Desulfobacterium sp.]MBU3947216.1 enoyl-CoA hydratase/isomerase family protein [Pseudomonadota bacterium]MBU4010965.1 enoyl-CoA hydratase/isomerase family protein [Pseudomonadota bacterium]